MSYRIRYNPETDRKYPIIKKRKYIKKLLLAGLAALLSFIVVRYRADIIRLLLPGDPDVTAQALQSFFMDMRNGTTSDAIDAFCRQIIANGAG